MTTLNLNYYNTEIAIYDSSREISYKELSRLVNSHQDDSSIFYAPPTIETIVHILSLLKKGKRIAPISPREHKLPTLTLPDGCGTCLATSGSSGFPKYVIHSLDAHIFSASHSHPDWVLNPGDKWRLSLPLNHVGGLAILFRTLHSGAAIILPTSSVLPTHVSFVSTQLKRYLKDPIGSEILKGILVGGGPVPEELCIEATKIGLPIYLTYGMTEMASQVATAPYQIEEGPHVGPGLYGREITIAPDKEILIRSQTTATSYLHAPLPNIDGWYQTGDLGSLNNGQLRLLGRKDQMIISGGENIYLTEIENALLILPGIIKANVQSRPDEEYGARPTIRAITDNLTPKQIREALLETLPRFKVPSESDIQTKPF